MYMTHLQFLTYVSTNLSKKLQTSLVELVWRSGCVMDCHATARGSIPSRSGVNTELHIIRKGRFMAVASLNDLNVNMTLNTTN